MEESQQREKIGWIFFLLKKPFLFCSVLFIELDWLEHEA
jgi:hypothetical protein